MKNLLLKVALPFLVAGSLLAPARAQSINIFVPRDTQTTFYYGSGDADSSGVIDWNDYSAMQAGISNDRTDVNGDGITDEQDTPFLSDYLNQNISYLPGHFNSLQTREERDDWFQNTNIIDTTSEENLPICWKFALRTHANFYGIPDTTNSLISLPDNQRFNIPLMYVLLSPTNGGEGHAIVGACFGDDAIEWHDWNFAEPQNNHTNLQIGSSSLPFNRLIEIYKIEGFRESGAPITTLLVAFQIDESGNVSLYTSNPNYPNGYNPDLILTRPGVSIENKVVSSPSNYVLGKNYPNPFNSRTTINYKIPQRGPVKFTIIDILGKEKRTLIDKVQEPGNYSINFDGSSLPSGVYFYQITTASGPTLTGRMILLK